jgi:hypothetical protein
VVGCVSENAIFDIAVIRVKKSMIIRNIHSSWDLVLVGITCDLRLKPAREGIHRDN